MPPELPPTPGLPDVYVAHVSATDTDRYSFAVNLDDEPTEARCRGLDLADALRLAVLCAQALRQAGLWAVVIFDHGDSDYELAYEEEEEWILDGPDGYGEAIERLRPGSHEYLDEVGVGKTRIRQPQR